MWKLNKKYITKLCSVCGKEFDSNLPNQEYCSYKCNQAIVKERLNLSAKISKNDKELFLSKIYRKGTQGKKVELIQEWLSLHGFGLKIDGDFGPATEWAVKSFQREERIIACGIVGIDTFKRLIKPMKNALKEIPKENRTLGEMVVAYASRHLNQHPREIGGQNKGPWVRLYMKGHEGIAWPWCAGFVSFILKQACDTLGVSLPLKMSFSCDEIAKNASREDNFWSGDSISDKKKITPGSLFLEKKSSTDWTHTGIVVAARDDIFITIEGNTNDEGSREGYEVCGRVRGYKNKDFVLI